MSQRNKAIPIVGILLLIPVLLIACYLLVKGWGTGSTLIAIFQIVSALSGTIGFLVPGKVVKQMGIALLSTLTLFIIGYITYPFITGQEGKFGYSLPELLLYTSPVWSFSALAAFLLFRDLKQVR